MREVLNSFFFCLFNNKKEISIDFLLSLKKITKSFVQFLCPLRRAIIFESRADFTTAILTAFFIRSVCCFNDKLSFNKNDSVCSNEL